MNIENETAPERIAADIPSNIWYDASYPTESTYVREDIHRRVLGELEEERANVFRLTQDLHRNTWVATLFICGTVYLAAVLVFVK